MGTPVRPNRTFLRNAPGWLSRLVERWQLGGILNRTSGAPLTIGAAVSSWIQLTNQTPMLVGDFPKSTGKVVKTSVPGVLTYFDGFQQITDPGISNITTVDSLRSQFNNYAIADSQGKVVLINRVLDSGNLGLRSIEVGQFPAGHEPGNHIKVPESGKFVPTRSIY
jgi:hypothetical protein